MNKIDAINVLREHLQNRKMEQVKELANHMDPFDLADIIDTLEPEKQVMTFRLLSKQNALEVFEHLETSTQQDLLAAFTDDKTIELFSSLEPDDRVRLVEELPAGIAKKLLSSLDPHERELTAGLLGYRAESAGRLMTPKYIRLNKKMTIAQAIEKVRQTGRDIEPMMDLYVTDDERKIEGTISLQSLVMEDPQRSVSEMMNTRIKWVDTDTDQEIVARMLQDRDVFSLPVTDREDRLVGVITVDDAMDVMEEEATEDIYNKAGLIDINKSETDRSHRLVNGSLLQVFKVRIPFLIITLLGGLLAGALIAGFEDALEEVVAIAFFVPVVMDMGGNVGTQSSTIFTRALVLGQIDLNAFMGKWLREIRIGTGMGILLGSAAAVLATLWQGSWQLGAVVGVSLALTITIATGLGFFIPYLLFKLGFDQAAGADPIITTIKDISGLAIYFMLATTFLL